MCESSFQLKWDFFVRCASIGAAALDLDELEVTGNELEAVFLLAVCAFPLLLVQGAHDYDPGATVEKLFRDLGQAAKTNDPDPAGPLLGGTEGQAECG
jgi:hypothetical protein